MSRPRDPNLRDAVLAAAAREFADHGFARASMAAIGRRAGVTKGGVYFHFRAKEELFFAVVDQWRAGLRRELEPAEGARADAVLRAFLAAFLRYHFENPRAARLPWVLATELRERFTAQVRDDLRDVLRALRARVRELLVEGAQDGSLFATDPAFSAFLVVAAIEGVLHQWLAAPDDAGPFCHAESLADALVAPHATGRGEQHGPPPGGAPVHDEFRPRY